MDNDSEIKTLTDAFDVLIRFADSRDDYLLAAMLETARIQFAEHHTHAAN